MDILLSEESVRGLRSISKINPSFKTAFDSVLLRAKLASICLVGDDFWRVFDYYYFLNIDITLEEMLGTYTYRIRYYAESTFKITHIETALM